MSNCDGKNIQAIRVLLVEDEPGDAHLVILVLRDQEGRFRVSHVTCLEQALARLASYSFDVVLLDLSLPYSHGFATITTVRAAAPALPLIVLTGLNDNRIAVAAVEAGAQDFLVKGEFEETMIQRAIRHGSLEDQLKASEDRLKCVLDMAHDAVISVDSRQRIILFNPAAERMFGYRAEEILGEPLGRLVPEAMRATHDAHFMDFVEQGYPICVRTNRPEVTGLRRDGNTFPIEISLSRWEGPDGTICTAMIRDITDRLQAQAELQHLATTDPLTGIANRRHFLDRATQELNRLRRFGNPVSLIMLDVDHFKRINDTYGHSAGDQALCLLTSTCRDILRENDLVGRMGGEEFAILLPETGLEEASWVADRVRRCLSELVVAENSVEFGFTVSLGVAGCDRDDRRIEEPLARADRALYDAKRAGRNRITIDWFSGQAA
jgi:two-component system cell cycle response regulator